MSKIDYDLSKIKGVAFDVDGVLSPTVIPMDSDGTPLRMMNLKDGYALKCAVKQGLKLAIISGASGEAVMKRFTSLGINDVYLMVGDKIDCFRDWMEANGLESEEVAFVGDDIPDYDCMMHAGLSVAPADAAVDIKSIAGYISPCNGGYGVARDLLEEILRVKNLWVTHAKAFGW